VAPAAGGIAVASGDQDRRLRGGAAGRMVPRVQRWRRQINASVIRAVSATAAAAVAAHLLVT